METLRDHIKNNYDTQAEFAKEWKVEPQHVSRWIKLDYRIEFDVLFSPVRRLSDARTDKK